MCQWSHFGVHRGWRAARFRRAPPGTLEGMHPPVRLVAIDIDGTLLPTFSQAISARNAAALKAAQQAGIFVAIATGRRTAYTAPLFEGMGLRADTPLITSNGAVTRTLGGDPVDRSQLEARVARGLCGLLRKFGAMVFTFDKIGHGELVLEDLEQTHDRISLWVEANRDGIELVKPLEKALVEGNDPIQGMVAGGISQMKKAEKALKESVWAVSCECVRTEYPGRDLSILDLLPPGVSKGWALERLAQRLGVDQKETMAIGDNWNDVDMLEWAGQSVMMGNAAQELRTMAKMRGWKQTQPNDEDGVAIVLENLLKRQAEASGRPKHWASMARS
jgi:Cof subfamily protein (haloacid dehalogenase superfamily)